MSPGQSPTPSPEHSSSGSKKVAICPTTKNPTSTPRSSINSCSTTTPHTISVSGIGRNAVPSALAYRANLFANYAAEGLFELRGLAFDVLTQGFIDQRLVAD